MDWIQLTQQLPPEETIFWIPTKDYEKTGEAVLVTLIPASNGIIAGVDYNGNILPFTKWATKEVQY